MRRISARAISLCVGYTNRAYCIAPCFPSCPGSGTSCRSLFPLEDPMTVSLLDGPELLNLCWDVVGFDVMRNAREAVFAEN